MLIRRVPWAEQPQDFEDIDWGGPFARQLAFCALLSPGAEYSNLATGQPLTRTGALAPGTAPNGRYPTFSATSYIDVSANLVGIGQDTPITFAWTQFPVATSAYSTVLNWKPVGAANPFLIYLSASDAHYYFVAGPRTGSNVNVATFSTAAGAVTNGVLSKYCLIVPAGTADASTATLYRNGVQVTRGTSVPANSLAANTSTVFRIGALETAGDPFEGLLGNMHIWGRAFSESEARDWTLNEFIALRPRRIWVPQNAAAAVAGNAPRYMHRTQHGMS